MIVQVCNHYDGGDNAVLIDESKRFAKVYCRLRQYDEEASVGIGAGITCEQFSRNQR